MDRSIWNAAELSASAEWRHRLDDDERDELLGTGAMPRLERRLAEIQHQLEHGTGAVRIERFPSEGLDEAEQRRIYLRLSECLGTPVSQSAEGERVFSVRDAGFGSDDPRSRGPNTKKRLSFHTDRADVVGFLCLQQAREGGENEVASSRGVYEAIRERHPELLEELMQPYFYLRHTVDGGNEHPWCRQPVFSFTDGYFACCFLRVLIERAYKHPELPEMTASQREALDTVERIAAEEGRFLRFRQQPGDLLFMNNWLVLHRRTAFVDHDEPARRRHILRLWLSMPNSRPIDPLFVDNFGATAAGAIRGGMRAKG